VITEHKLGWLASFVDRLIVLQAGRMAADGEPRRVLSQAASEPWGVGATDYTRAAQEVRRLGRLPATDELLPVTLEQALERLR
jgi:energy-coupling factor transporter ATP-binding protein EcfA2